jgi:hypothetical protein
MKFSFFEPPADRQLRKSREYLEDAKLKRVEHQAAAERHRAMTELYAERIRRIEAQIKQAGQAPSNPGQAIAAANNDSTRPVSDCEQMHRPRTSHA